MIIPMTITGIVLKFGCGYMAVSRKHTSEVARYVREVNVRFTEIGNSKRVWFLYGSGRWNIGYYSAENVPSIEVHLYTGDRVGAINFLSGMTEALDLIGL